jgi:hypothetical protein
VKYYYEQSVRFVIDRMKSKPQLPREAVNHMLELIENEIDKNSPAMCDLERLCNAIGAKNSIKNNPDDIRLPLVTLNALSIGRGFVCDKAKGWAQEFKNTQTQKATDKPGKQPIRA